MSATLLPSCVPRTNCSLSQHSASAAKRCHPLPQSPASTWKPPTGDDAAGTRIEIAGGKIHRVDDAALPRGTTIAVADLFFNTPARRKFLRAESTELSHVTALVTHYALAHPEKHFELLSASHTLISAPPVGRTAERVYQILGKDTLAQLLPVAAEAPLGHAGLPEPPPWKRDPDEQKRDPGTLRLSGFYSKPELQKLNRNSIYIFVNKRLDTRSPPDACHHRGLSQHHPSDLFSRRLALPGDASRRS